MICCFSDLFQTHFKGSKGIKIKGKRGKKIASKYNNLREKILFLTIIFPDFFHEHTWGSKKQQINWVWPKEWPHDNDVSWHCDNLLYRHTRSYTFIYKCYYPKISKTHRHWRLLSPKTYIGQWICSKKSFTYKSRGMHLYY